MKTISCNDMGGACDAKISGNTPDELIANGMKHVEQAHPEMAKNIKAMSQEDMAAWGADFQKKWDATPASADSK